MYVQKGNRVLVHCHAGMGRTGIICASYLIYCGKAINMQEALSILRAHRKGMMGKSETQECVKKFEQWLTASRRQFYPA